jgi:ribonuclease HII
MEYFIGIDEVGRGALAGPVVVGAVALLSEEVPAKLQEIFPKGLRDSKKATLKQRHLVNDLVRSRYIWGVGEVGPEIIDAQGLSFALHQAAGFAIEAITAQLTGTFHIHADAGLFHPYEDKYITVRSVKADETITQVLLASHVAKVYRDTLMQKHAIDHPEYGWMSNVGYGSVAHMEAIRERGITSHHRTSFLKQIK